MKENKKLLDYFSQDFLAASVWKSKYAAKGELTPDYMFKRMAKEFARIEKNYIEKEGHLLPDNLSEYAYERHMLDEESIYKLFKDFKYIVPQGSIMYGLGRNTPVSLSNCFVIDSPKDSYGGIMLTDQEQAQLMKRRGGVGHDLSLLRPKGTKVHNSAKSSTGITSFMHRFSNTTREVAQDGRRGALMLSIDVNHPDVMDFIKIKRDGISVTGANISIKLNNEFMEAVENDEDYILRFPCTAQLSEMYWEGNDTTDKGFEGFNLNELYQVYQNSSEKVYIKRIKAKEYWNEIVKSARNYAEPGILFWDKILDYAPDGVYEQHKALTTNPCGEIPMGAYDSCRLMCLNLFSFVDNPFTTEADVNYKKLYEISYEQQRLMDDLVDLEIESIEKIINKIKNDSEPLEVKQTELNLWIKILETAKSGRRTGSGITALADMLAALNLKYDSDEALEVIDLVMKTKMEAELDCNIDLAILRGSFDGWNVDKEFPTNDDDITIGANSFYKMMQKEFPNQYLRMYEYGRRSVSFSTIAPTGSVSILTQTTSGCEPIFQPFYMRRKKINPNDEGSRVDFVDESGDSWQEFPVLHEKFKEWLSTWDISTYVGMKNIIDLNNKELQILFEMSPWYGSTANDIDWIKRNEMQAVLQKYTTNAISSTINLPSTTTEQEVSDIYMDGWKRGLKGQTVYVDGSRSGVLVSNNEQKKDNNTFEYKDAVKRPKELKAEAYVSTVKKVKYNVIVGLLDNKPYEVFITNHFTNESDLILRKVKKGRYDLLKNDEVYSEDITTEMSESEEAITRMVSTSLRHGVNIKFIVEQLNKTSGSINSFNKAIARILKKYISNGEKSTLKSLDGCTTQTECNIVFEEGCTKCKTCGNSLC